MSESKLWQLRAGLITENEYQNSMEEAGFNISKNDTPNIVGNQPRSVSDLAKKLTQIGLKLKMMKGIDTNEIKNVGQLLDDILAKIETGNLGTALVAADKAFNASTKGLNISKNEYQNSMEEAGFNISKNDTPNIVGNQP